MNITMNTTVQLLHIAKNQQGLHSVMNTKMNTKMNPKYGRGIRTRNTDAEYEQILSTKIPSSQFFDGLKHDDLGPFSMKVFSR